MPYKKRFYKAQNIPLKKVKKSDQPYTLTYGDENYDPEKAFPRLRNATWREIEETVYPVKYLTREEIEREYPNG